MDWHRALKYNPNHEAAGSGRGGQFAKKPGGSSSPLEGSVAQYLVSPSITDYLERQHKDGLTHGDYRGMTAIATVNAINDRHPHIKTEHLGKVYPFMLREVASELDRLKVSNPDATAALKRVALGDTPDGIFERHPRAWAAHHSNSIYLNPTFFEMTGVEGAKELLHQLKKSEQVGYHTPGGDTIASIFTHEFGHHVQHWDLMGAKRSTEMLESRLTEVLGMESDVSGYARVNSRESFAERFTLAYNPHARPKDMSKKLRDVFDTYFTDYYKFVTGKVRKFLKMLQTTAIKFDEAKHPRNPKGGSQGGQFTDSGRAGDSTYIRLEPANDPGAMTLLEVAKFFDHGGKLEWQEKAGMSAKQKAQVQANVEQAMQNMAQEVRYQLTQERSGLNWYQTDIRDAFTVTGKHIPELLPKNDGLLEQYRSSKQQLLFATMAGILSPSAVADANWVMAARAFEEYKKTGKVPHLDPHTGGLWQGGLVSGIKTKAMKALDNLIQEKGEDGAIDWMAREHSELSLAYARKSYAKSPVTGFTLQSASDRNPGYTIFGPKVGPFIGALNGVDSDVVVDRWAIRTFNRHFRNMLGTVDGVTNMVDAPRSPAEREQLTKMITEVAKRTNIKPNQVQSVLWFYEQNLYTHMGAVSKSTFFSDGAHIYDDIKQGKRPIHTSPKKKPFKKADDSFTPEMNLMVASMLRRRCDISDRVTKADISQSDLNIAGRLPASEFGFVSSYKPKSRKKRKYRHILKFNEHHGPDGRFAHSDGTTLPAKDPGVGRHPKGYGGHYYSFLEGGEYKATVLTSKPLAGVEHHMIRHYNHADNDPEKELADYMGVKAKPGEILLYRVHGKEGTDLTYRNAGDALAVAHFVGHADDNLLGIGDTITAYSVKLPEVFGEYHHLRGGRKPEKRPLTHWEQRYGTGTVKYDKNQPRDKDGRWTLTAGFMREYHEATFDHPFDPRIRLHNARNVDQEGWVGLEVRANPDAPSAHISSIISFGSKNKGNASLSLDWLNKLADKHNITMDLFAKAIPNAGHPQGKNLTTAKLKEWYARHGFKGGERMARTPNPVPGELMPVVEAPIVKKRRIKKNQFISILKFNASHQPAGAANSSGGQFTSTKHTMASLGKKPEWDEDMRAHADRVKDLPWEHLDNQAFVARMDALREVERKWERDVKMALTEGDITQAQAKELGMYFTGGEKYAPLPPTLYHVTVADSAVMHDGFKTRDEHGKSGLGGGTSDTISLTDNRQMAEQYLNGMLEMHDMLNDRLPITKLIDQAKAGHKAEREWMTQVHETYARESPDKLIDGMPSRLYDVLHDTNTWHVPWLKDKSVTQLETMLGMSGKKDAIGGKVFQSEWLQKPLTADEKIARQYEFMSRWMFMRDAVGKGPVNPLFFTSDMKKFRDTPRGELQLLEVDTKPGAQGYHVPAENEFRVHTGKVLKVKDRIKVKKQHWFAGGYPDEGSGYTMKIRYVGDAADCHRALSGELDHIDNFEDSAVISMIKAKAAMQTTAKEKVQAYLKQSLTGIGLGLGVSGRPDRRWVREELVAKFNKNHDEKGLFAATSSHTEAGPADMESLRNGTRAAAVNYVGFKVKAQRGMKIESAEDVLADYAGLGYHRVNGLARGTLQGGSPGYLAQARDEVAVMDNLLATAPPLDKPIGVWRGVTSLKNVPGLTQEEIHKDATVLIGREFIEHGFVSTSGNRNTGIKFADSTAYTGVVFNYRVPEGTRVLAPYWKSEGKLISTTEEEVILPRGSKFKVISVKRVQEGDTPHWQVNAEYLGNDPQPVKVPGRKRKADEKLDRFIAPEMDWLPKVQKFNQQHVPAGTSEGGQFASLRGLQASEAKKVRVGTQWKPGSPSVLGIEGKFAGTIKDVHSINPANVNVLIKDVRDLFEKVINNEHVPNNQKEAAGKALAFTEYALDTDPAHSTGDRPYRKAFVALDQEGRVMGAARMSDRGYGDVELEYLGSLQRGAGSALLHQIEDFARQRYGATHLFLSSSEYAKEFYKKQGFKKSRQKGFDFEKDLTTTAKAELEVMDDEPTGVLCVSSGYAREVLRAKLRKFDTAKPRTLYVSRHLLNGDDVLAWAKEQGFGKTLLPDDMHVTIAFSRTKVVWSEMKEESGQGNLVIKGGKRSVSPLGDKGAVVLKFESQPLHDRWAQLVKRGCSWDYEGYTSHVTITYDGEDMDLSKVEPFKGTLKFGPEIFNEVAEDWSDSIVEKGEGFLL